jgi:VanZ family protein
MGQVTVFRRFLWHWLPPLVWMGAIFFLSSQSDLPRAPEPWFDVLLKKTAHAVAFGLLAWLYRRALSGHASATAAVRLASAGLAILYGASDEFHQTFVPGRNGQLFDVGVDAAGVCGAMLLDWWLACRGWLRSTGNQTTEKPPSEDRPSPAR